MENINLLSIAIEVIVVILAVTAAIRMKRPCGWFWAFTFLVYVFYDLARTEAWQISPVLMGMSFLAASVSAAIGAILMNRK